MEGMIQVADSSSIAGYKYNEQGETLTIEFIKTKDAYTFFDVPFVVADEFERAESKGKYFYAYIRGRYRFVKHGPETEAPARDEKQDTAARS